MNGFTQKVVLNHEFDYLKSIEPYIFSIGFTTKRIRRFVIVKIR